MSNKQGMVDILTTHMDDLLKIREFMDVIFNYLDKSKGKKELMDFSENTLLDSFLTASELKLMYVKFTINPSYGNIHNLKSFINNSKKLKSINKDFKKRDKEIINNFIEYLKDINTEISQLKYDDVHERLMALRRSISKIINIEGSLRAPYSVDSIRELQPRSDDYLTCTFDELLKQFEEKFEGKYEIAIEAFEKSNDAGWNLSNINVLKTLQNYLDYLDTLLKY